VRKIELNRLNWNYSIEFSTRQPKIFTRHVRAHFSSPACSIIGRIQRYFERRTMNICIWCTHDCRFHGNLNCVVLPHFLVDTYVPMSEWRCVGTSYPPRDNPGSDMIPCEYFFLPVSTDPGNRLVCVHITHSAAGPPRPRRSRRRALTALLAHEHTFLIVHYQPKCM
jgi:hypothetical protein